ncbi:MAG: biotin--[acetyl-CoA-carboxylase] ligase [Bacteroidales bacterium]|nr:biotin--[acetyl-CoA-carboxylase] ligase [Bacteroidales bacterium]
MLKYVHLEQTDSTNAYLQRQQSGCDIRNWVVSADGQTAGKGMGSNTWESEVGKNLTFSLALGVDFLPAGRQFLLSEAVALGLVQALDALLPSEKLLIKWPNDIYYENRKLAGILINSTIKANMMDVSIIGIGLNVNQMQFQNWPTHPISLKQITGKTYDLQPLLEQIAVHISNKVEQLKSNPALIEQEYLKRLFRYRTWAEYEIGGKVLQLYMKGIDEFGRLLLINKENQMLCFDIKEIKFLL